VQFIVLCPSIRLTWMMSFVLWYSIVAFQCLKVWSVIFIKFGLDSFIAIRFLVLRYISLSVCLVIVNIFCWFLGDLFRSAISLSLIGSILGLLRFDGVMVRVLRSVLKSVHWSFISSSVLIPVSFRVKRAVAYFGLDDAIIWSISCSVGMYGYLSSFAYLVLVHFFSDLFNAVVVVSCYEVFGDVSPFCVG
jgi:hypothetical protein